MGARDSGGDAAEHTAAASSAIMVGWMSDDLREIIALTIAATVALTMLVWAVLAWRRKKRIALRRRGVKRHGH